MGLVLPSVKGGANTCEEYENNLIFSLDLGNSTGTLDCSKISPSSLSTCLSANSVITTINTNINNNATAIGEVAQDLTDAQTALQTNINTLTTLVNNQNTTISDLNNQIATLISAFNALDSTVASFNSRLLSVEGRLTTLEEAIAAGIIVVWSGAVVDIPTGWFLCNGQNSTPDLRNRFIVGAGSTYAVNAIGGSINHTHNITGTTASKALTIDQLPSHTHGVTDTGHAHYVYNGNALLRSTVVQNSVQPQGAEVSTLFNGDPVTAGSSVTGISIQNTGANSGHNHDFSSVSSSSSNLVPYYALAYIMKV
jgi:hypothetical protein